MIVRSPKSDTGSITTLYHFLYENSEAVGVRLVEMYEDIDHEYSSLQVDMESVEEQVEIAEEAMDEAKEMVKELLDDLTGMKKGEIKDKLQEILEKLER